MSLEGLPLARCTALSKLLIPLENTHFLTCKMGAVKRSKCGSSLVAYWLGFRAFTAEGLGSIPGRDRKSVV